MDRLGRMPDAQLAELAGVHPETVATERRRRGIPAFRGRRARVEWTPEMIARLGKASDRDVAAELDLHHGSVFRKRRLLGIPPYQEPKVEDQGYAWPPHAVAMLGTASDRDVAEELGISFTSVAMKRKLLQIPPFQAPNEQIEWTQEMVAQLGVAPDRAVAARFGLGTKSVSRKREELGIAAAEWEELPAADVPPEVREALTRRTSEAMRLLDVSEATVQRWRARCGVSPPARDWRWTPEVVARLGNEPDSRIAEDLGVTAGAVGYMRRRLGVAPCPRSRRWTEEELTMLGAVPDRELAERFGRTTEAVRRKRETMDIPRWTSPNRWSEDDVELLGAAPDAEVARQLQRTAAAVRAKRWRLGISRPTGTGDD